VHTVSDVEKRFDVVVKHVSDGYPTKYVTRARAFDEAHRVRATHSAKVSSHIQPVSAPQS